MKNEIVIRICVNEESDLYNTLDDSKTTLSNDVISYYEDKISHTTLNDTFIIEIVSKKNIDIESFREAFRYYLADKITDYKQDMKRDTIKEIFFLILGVFFLLTSYSFNKNGHILVDFMSIMGWFSIWEMANLMILENRNDRREIYKLKQGLSSVITYVKK